MAKVLLLSLVFPPDAVSTAQLMGELMTDLRDQGHDVTVITTTPHYNRDLEAEKQQPLSRFAVFFKRSSFHGMTVYHCLMPPKGRNVAGRLMAWMLFHVLSILVATLFVRRCEIVFAPSPPLTIGLCAWIVSLLHRARTIYNVQELYPDIAVSLGIISNPGLIRLLDALASFIYSRSTVVTVIAPHMRRKLLEKGVPPGKVLTIPNFVDLDNLFPQPRKNAFSAAHALDDAFVVSYAGNMGAAQGLETLVEAAEILRHESSIRFLLLGDGNLRDSLRTRVLESQLSNVTFLDYQPFSAMGQIYAASDLCIVPLAAGAGLDAVPSKVYRIMACARPVLAITDPESDLADLVAVSGGGERIAAGDAEAIAAFLRSAAKERKRWQEKGEAGRRYVIEHHSRPVVTSTYGDLVTRIAQQR